MSVLPNPLPRDSFDFGDSVAAFLTSPELPFAKVLTEDRVERVFAKHDGMFGRTYTTAVVWWAFMGQVLRDGKESACQSAVTRISSFLQLSVQGLHAKLIDWRDCTVASALELFSTGRCCSCRRPILPSEADLADRYPSTIAPPWCPPKKSVLRSRIGTQAGVKRNFQILPPLDFLAEFTQHIPPKGSHLIRYYGWYANKLRSMPRRRKLKHPSSRQPHAAAKHGRC